MEGSIRGEWPDVATIKFGSGDEILNCGVGGEDDKFMDTETNGHDIPVGFGKSFQCLVRCWAGTRQLREVPNNWEGCGTRWRFGGGGGLELVEQEETRGEEDEEGQHFVSLVKIDK